MTLSHCSSEMKHNETQLNHSVHDCEIYDSEEKKAHYRTEASIR